MAISAVDSSQVWIAKAPEVLPIENACASYSACDRLPPWSGGVHTSGDRIGPSLCVACACVRHCVGRRRRD
eukprot:6196704-Pleurochrysis_carterae.AAC.2